MLAYVAAQPAQVKFSVINPINHILVEVAYSVKKKIARFLDLA